MRLFLPSDDAVAPAIPVLKDLREQLREVGYEATRILPLPGPLRDLPLDPLHALRAMQGGENRFHRSAASGLFRACLALAHPRVVELHRLFLLEEPMRRSRAEAALSLGLLDRLIGIGAIEEGAEGVRARILAVPHGGDVYLSDPISHQDHDEYVYMGRPTFIAADHVMAGARGAPGGSRLLDIGCGGGFGALVCASAFEEVVGSDVVERCLRFARVNAAVQGISNTTFRRSDLYANVDGTFDVVIANTPCGWVETERGRPKVFACGGEDYGTAIPTRMIEGALDRLRPGGSVHAVLSAPVVRRKPYVVSVLERICAARPARAIVRPIFEEYRLRNARLYRRHGISSVVRYLVSLDPAGRFEVEFRHLDAPRLWSYRLRAIPPRLAALVPGVARERPARRDPA